MRRARPAFRRLLRRSERRRLEIEELGRSLSERDHLIQQRLGLRRRFLALADPCLLLGREVKDMSEETVLVTNRHAAKDLRPSGLPECGHLGHDFAATVEVFALPGNYLDEAG